MTRSCPDCAAPLDAAERFCGECGAYVQWAEEPPEGATSSPPPPPPPRGDEERPTPPEPVRTMAVPIDEDPQGPGPQRPAPQQPRAAAPKPRQRQRPDDEPLRHGDLICGECGTGNKPARKFCRRCGNALAEAETARLPWWRRLLQRRHRTPTAGARPRERRHRRIPTGLLVVLGLLAALGVSGYLLRGHVESAYDEVHDRISGVEKTNPELSASSSRRGHGAGLARDGTTNRYWAPAAPGEGASLVATFESPVRLVYIVVMPGASGSDEETYLRHGRPARIRAVLTRSDGRTETELIDVADEVGPQEVKLATSDVTELELEIIDSYAGSIPGSPTAIAEVEFYVRR